MQKNKDATTKNYKISHTLIHCNRHSHIDYKSMKYMDPFRSVGMPSMLAMNDSQYYR
jgi:hypothetical protein